MNIEHLLDKIGQARFASFTYDKKSGEKARYTLQLGVSYLNCLKRSLSQAQELTASDLDCNDHILFNRAKKAIIQSLEKSIEAKKQGKQNIDYKKKNIYRNLGKGVVQHIVDGSFEIQGLTRKKVVLTSAPESSGGETKYAALKARIRGKLDIGSWRSFCFEDLEQARLNGFLLHKNINAPVKIPLDEKISESFSVPIEAGKE